MKTLKFRDYLIPLILSGEKTSTWRLFDDKNLKTNDIIILSDFENNKPFAKAKITRVIQKPFGKLNASDRKGHEAYQTEEEMYKTYTEYYNRTVDANTELKIIRFEIIATR